ncbi:ArnT family glycosyltransferase [Paenibacillus flagellatus]|uniref:Glycosyltransferase RgtA/B/C/D-like domain-containing protein n=1 Tax=Paenibacillus flagellatus TaxID=2211139 RepID=A0A2V5K1W0_9BACL|nr:glycosyltransferase family 39 protein [Paenibacillus flagellatus]PYI53121.1 hypothetical protein DLM86_19220 [Paenibacillus flagellatus]
MDRTGEPLGRRTAINVYRAALGVILTLALALRLHYVLNETYAPVEWDQLEYTKLAIQLLEHGFYAYRDTVPNTLVTPGFPMLLVAVYALFGYDAANPASMDSYMAVRVLNCFMSVGAIGFLYLIGTRLFHRFAGLLAALFAAVYAQYVWACSLILTEVPFLLAFTAFLYMQVRVVQDNRLRDHAIMGLLLAAVVLIRPNTLPLAVVPYLFLWARHRKPFAKEIGYAAAAFVLLMSPWWIRNGMTFHAFIPVARGEAGNPFLGGTDPYFRGTIDWTRVNAMSGEEQMAEGLRRIKQGLIDDPWLWIKWFTVGKFAVFFNHLWVGPYQVFVPDWYFAALRRLHFLLVYAGWFTLLTLRTRSLRLLFANLALFLGIHLLFIPVDRYSFGMMPFLMLGTAYLASSAAFVLARLVRLIPAWRQRPE